MKNTRRDRPVAQRDGSDAVRARARNRTVTRIKCLAATLLLAASSAHGYLGTFDPDLHEYTGPQLVTFVDSNAAPLECIGLTADIGDVGGAVLGLLAPMADLQRQAPVHHHHRQQGFELFPSWRAGARLPEVGAAMAGRPAR